MRMSDRVAGVAIVHVASVRSLCDVHCNIHCPTSTPSSVVRRKMWERDLLK